MNPENIERNLSQLSNNLCLYYSHLVDEIYQRLMDKALLAGHKGLKLSHALILPQISKNGSRIIDIAKSQSVSKQAIGQIANELELLGYISRSVDIEDKRSKKLILTPQGIDLINHAAGFMQEVENELCTEMGENILQTIKLHSTHLFKSLELNYPIAGQYTPKLPKDLPLIVYATSIATYLDFLLQQQNSLHGHPPLKRSYWHVLEKITQQGVRINDLAVRNGISKQAISQLAHEIEKAGYISRSEDPTDKRAKHLFLSTKGEELIIHSLSSTKYVELVIESKIGKIATDELKTALQHYFFPKVTMQLSNKMNNTQALQSLLKKFSEQLDETEKSLWLIPNNDGSNEKWFFSDYAINTIKKITF